MAPVLKPFQLLEINIISAQDLAPVSKKMKTYATAWVNPTRKLSSCIDGEGQNNPTWNDKFVFRVDDAFLKEDTSAVMIEIYTAHWFRDVLVGTVRVLVGNLIPPPARSQGHGNHHIGMRFVALQVRRPSGRPQGILNIGVALLNRSMKNMPLYRQLSTSAVGYRTLMDDQPSLQNLRKTNDNIKNKPPTTVKPILRRSKSERSERVTFESSNSPNGSLVAIAAEKKLAKEGSILSFADQYVDPVRGTKKKGKASSVISGAELREKPKPKGGKKTKASSVLSDSIFSKSTASFRKIGYPKSKINKEPKKEETSPILNEKLLIKAVKNVSPKEKPLLPLQKYNSYESNPPKGRKYLIPAAPYKNGSRWSDSEVGPSPSEVAAALAVQKRYPLEDNQSSVLDGWSVDESVEGLRSKLERWRRELPPVYGRRDGYSTSSYSRTPGRQTRRTPGRQSDPGVGLFSCFGNIYGYECQCVCGKPPERRNRSTRFHSPSVGTSGRSFL